jgi:hypothetical protein
VHYNKKTSEEVLYNAYAWRSIVEAVATAIQQVGPTIYIAELILKQLSVRAELVDNSRTMLQQDWFSLFS